MRFAVSIEQNFPGLMSLQNAVFVRVMNSARYLRDEFDRARIGIGSRFATSSSWPPSMNFMLK